LTNFAVVREFTLWLQRSRCYKLTCIDDDYASATDGNVCSRTTVSYRARLLLAPKNYRQYALSSPRTNGLKFTVICIIAANQMTLVIYFGVC